MFPWGLAGYPIPEAEYAMLAGIAEASFSERDSCEGIMRSSRTPRVYISPRDVQYPHILPYQ